MIHRKLTLFALLSGVAFAAPAHGQAANTPADQATPARAASAQAASADTTGLADIVVTAQRQSQNMQKVPIAISAITAAGLGASQITSTLQIAAAVPNLALTQNAYAVTPFLRGVGSNQPGPADEPSVATYIDGFYIASPAGNIFRLNDIERIEVLKGPQGTLFGRNATGGVIQIITKDPTQTPAFDGAITYGSYKTVEGNAYATTGLTNNLAIDGSVVFAANYKGFGYNIGLHEQTMKRNELSFRSKLLWTPDARTEIRLSGGYSRVFSSESDYQPVYGAITIAGVPSTLPPRISDTDYPNAFVSKAYDIELNIKHDLDFARFVSITGFRKANLFSTLDQDSTPIPAVQANIYEISKSYSQELQLLAPISSRINWLLGVYLFHIRAGYNPLDANNVVNYYTYTITNSIAGFGQATIPLDETTHLTGGVRFTHDHQMLDLTLVPAPLLVKKQETNKPTWRVALDHQFAPKILGYVSYNRGTKSGGYGLTDGNGYKPEVLDAYEVGLKTELFNKRVRFNIAAFYYNYKDIQVSIISDGAIDTQNAASAKDYGMDADLAFKVSSAFTITTGFGYTHATYSKFPDAPFYSVSAGSPANLQSATGNFLTGAPKITANAAFNYDVPTAIGVISSNFTISYRDKTFVGPDNRLAIPKYALANATVGWASLDKRFSVSFWARNVFNKSFPVNITEEALLGAIQTWNDPRTYGGTLGVKF